MENAASSGLDAVTLEILEHALSAAAEEMSITVWRTSRSTTVRELLDYSTAIFDAEGRNVAQSARMPVHLNSMQPCLQTIIKDHIPVDAWHEGDVIITNDPYSGGQHLPDVLAFKPVFVDGKRVAITGTLIHHVDVGGGAAGGYSANATEIYQEGIRIPPLKIIKDGELGQDILRMLMCNVREPEIFRGDLLSQLSALEVGARSVQAIAKKYRPDLFIQAGRAMIDNSRQAMEAAISAIPDGVYEAEDFVDGDGLSEDSKRLHVKLTVSDSRLFIDLSGSSEQARGPINCTLASSESAIYYAVIAATQVAASPNSGCYQPIEIIAPSGLIVNAASPAPVSMRVLVAHRLATAVLRAFSAAVPDRIPACYYGATYNHAALLLHRDGAREVYFDAEVGGWGGHPEEDGASGLAAGLHNIQNTPVEMIEALYPIKFLRYGLIPDSGGAGRKRGGLGIVREWQFQGDRGYFNASFDAFVSRPYGLAGGNPGRGGALSITRSGVKRTLPAKVIGAELRSGDIVTIETPGGGGHGSPDARTPEEIRADLEQGYVTSWPSQ